MTVCSFCGHDSRRDERITLDGVTFDPLSGVTVGDTKLHLTKTEHAVVGALMKAGGRILTAEFLADRMGHGGEDFDSAAKVRVFRLRTKFRAAGIEPPIETVWGRGYRWNAKQLECVE